MTAPSNIGHEIARCSVEQVFALVGGKWKIAILCALAERPHRYGELRRAVLGITHKVLTSDLRQLERDGLVVRRLLPGSSPGVEYSLSALAESLKSVLLALDDWGREHLAA